MEVLKKIWAPTPPGGDWGVGLDFGSKIWQNMEMWPCDHIHELGQKFFLLFCRPLRGLQEMGKKFGLGSFFDPPGQKNSLF